MSKHAPRGPIKRPKDPIASADPLALSCLGRGQRCSATSKRTGNPCPMPAIKGGTVCRMHGGAAPQVKAAAEFRVMDAYRALQPKCVAVVDTLLGRDEYPTVQIAAVREVMDRTEGKPTESVQMSGADGGPVTFRWEP